MSVAVAASHDGCGQDDDGVTERDANACRGHVGFCMKFGRVAGVVTRLAEVAKYAGVSEATVSRVLHDKPGIAQATRDSVLTALDVLGFQRPFKHRSEMARLVGMVLPDLHNPIFPAYAEAMA